MVLQHLSTNSLSDPIRERIPLPSTNAHHRLFAHEPGKLRLQLVLLKRPNDERQQRILPLLAFHDVWSQEKQVAVTRPDPELHTLEVRERRKPLVCKAARPPEQEVRVNISLRGDS